MTTPVWTDAGGTADEDGAAAVNCADRARFWRVAIGGLGLFWVCVVLALVGALIP